MGENTTDDLQSREDALAEMLAAEDGGFGYSVNSSNPLTDIDLQPDDSSSQFTDSGTGTQDYTDQFGDNEDDENETEQSNKGSKNSGEDDDNYNDDYDEKTPDNFDGGVEEESKKSESNKNDSSDEDSDKNGSNEKNQKQEGKTEQGKNEKKEKQHAVIPWKPGDKINLKLLAMVWDELHKIKEVEPLINSANEALKNFLLTIPDSTIMTYIKAHDGIRQWFGSSRSDLIGTLLDMAKSFGTRMVYTSVSAIIACGSQMWNDPLMFATLPAAIDLVLAQPILQAALQKIFEVAVPILEDMEASGKKKIVINY